MSNNFIEIQRDGGSLDLEILRGEGLKQFWKFRWKGGGGQKNDAFHQGVRIFSGITQYILTCIFSFLVS